MRITFVGLAGVPFSKRAIDVRLGATINLFLKLGYKVDVLNRFMPVKENVETDEYNIVNPYPDKRNVGRLKSAIYYFLSYLAEPFKLFKWNKKSHIDVLLVNSGHFFDMLIYKVVAKITGAKILYQYCEYRAAFATKNPYHILNGKFIGKFGAKLWDGAVCITTFLEDDCKKTNPAIKTMKMYPICDYGLFDRVETYNPGFKYLMFCGSVEYSEVVELILKSYQLSCINKTHKLLLVLRGNKKSIETIEKEYPEVIIESDLSYKNLIAHYKGATGLLIPLRDNIRDIARFPNKVCEYCASRRVVVTSNNGEMKYLFEDGVNAFVSEDFSVRQFSAALDRLANCETKEEIGMRSYNLGLQKFDMDSYKEITGKFIEDLIANK